MLVKRKSLVAACALATATLALPAAAATPFNFEAVDAGTYARALTVSDGSLVLTVTPEGFTSGSITVGNDGVPLLGAKAVVANQYASAVSGQFAPLRFSFSQALDSITFNFGDNGGDSDSPVTISAFDMAEVLLGSLTASYPAGKADGASLTLGFAGARYFIASSGSDRGNENSLFYDIGTYTQAAAAVPEAATWAMAMLGLGVVGSSARRRQKAGRRASFA